ncbi:MAG TPA: tetratricopeptide repeat protein [Blastocatellia bacterium]|jgi:tetratricopeptide (TPR) repeat protein|nr:tetratricopeptide repeat protein [Blastocatellia bacterium]
MNKPNFLYGIIGLLAGILIGYIGTVNINQANRPAATSGGPAGTSNTLPPDHPPTGATGTSGDSSGATGSGSNAGSQAEVMAVIERARKEPGNFEAQMQAADLFRQIDRFDGALEFYESAFKTRPKDFKLLVALGDTNFELKRYEEAERWYQSAVKQNPNDATVRNDLGLSFYLRSPRDLDRAITAFREALKIDSRYEKSLQNLTQALIDKGEKGAAGETLKRLEEVNPNNKALAPLRSQLQQ